METYDAIMAVVSDMLNIFFAIPEDTHSLLMGLIAGMVKGMLALAESIQNLFGMISA